MGTRRQFSREFKLEAVELVKGSLDAYAEVHARVHQVPVDAVALVPHMLAAFIARDRAFRAMVRR